MSDLVIRGARENNLKNVNLTLPFNKLICFTGVSGIIRDGYLKFPPFDKQQLQYQKTLNERKNRYLTETSPYFNKQARMPVSPVGTT